MEAGEQSAHYETNSLSFFLGVETPRTRSSKIVEVLNVECKADAQRSKEVFLSGLSKELGVDILEISNTLPCTAKGVVEGTFFCLYEHSGSWEVAVYPDADPLCSALVQKPNQRIVIGKGSADSLFDEDAATPIRKAVELVRSHLFR